MLICFWKTNLIMMLSKKFHLENYLVMLYLPFSQVFLFCLFTKNLKNEFEKTFFQYYWYIIQCIFLNFNLSDMKDIPEKTKITNAELQLSELCALAESIPRWVVKEKVKTHYAHPIVYLANLFSIFFCSQQIHSLKRIDKKALFGKGKLEEVTQYVRRISGDITAVVIGINTLNSMQLKFLQDLWKLPVYDR